MPLPDPIVPTTPAAPAPASSTATNPATPGAANDDDATAASGAQTIEEVEAFWRNRVSRKDRAHQEAERALREENASLKATRSTGQQTGSTGDGTGNEAMAELQRQLEQEKAARVIDQRKAKYPALVAQGVTDAIFASGDEPTLARLNALADDESGTGRIAPTAPRRAAPATQKPLNEKSKDELLADLKRASGPYEAALRQRG